MSRTSVTPLMVCYGAFAAVGAIVPWCFNIQYMRESRELLTPQAWVEGAFINALTASITSDFLNRNYPVLLWMMVEGGRIGMRHLWFYFVTTFLVAFAFSCPLFLLMREIRRNAQDR